MSVTAVSGGLEAWKILEDPSNHIDLVLTEVEMPSLSGVGLLANMTSHKTCKNIPLISKYLSVLPALAICIHHCQCLFLVAEYIATLVRVFVCSDVV